MIMHLKMLQNILAALFCLILFGISPVHAAYVAVTSDMTVSNLRFSLGDPNAQLQWTDVWAGEARAHTADSGSPASNDSNASLGNDVSIQAGADTNNGGSLAKFSISGTNITASSHTDMLFDQPGMQGDGSAVTTFDNFFKLTNPNDLNIQGSVQVNFLLDYNGSLSGMADEGGFFSGNTHFITFALADGISSLDSAVFTDSISGTNTTITRTNTGTLTISSLLSYNTEYFLSIVTDDETYTHTVPIPASIILFGSALLGLFGFSNRKLTTIKG